MGAWFDQMKLVIQVNMDAVYTIGSGARAESQDFLTHRNQAIDDPIEARPLP